MPSVSFMFRSHDPDGSPRATARLLSDALGHDAHLSSLADSVAKTLSQDHGECRLVLSVEEEPPVSVEFVPLAPELGVAYLTRGPTGAVVVLVSAAHSRLVAPDLKKLERDLKQLYPEPDFAPMFEWILQTKPPLATATYFRPGEPDTGVDTVAVCLAGAFFRAKSNL